tara:strand:+ start:11670 stop:12056 length:387 start_codon:yes stop_codon:yes gene_type:complete
MKKSTLEMLALVVIVLVGGHFMLGSGTSSQVAVTGNVVAAGGQVQEVVLGMKNNNYFPDTVTVDAGKKVRLSMDDSAYGCYRDFSLREFGVRKYLAKPSDYVEFVPNKKGTFTFSCSMGMGLGKLVVK